MPQPSHSRFYHTHNSGWWVSHTDFFLNCWRQVLSLIFILTMEKVQISVIKVGLWQITIERCAQATEPSFSTKIRILFRVEPLLYLSRRTAYLWAS
jgi:hypothetical protein